MEQVDVRQVDSAGEWFLLLKVEEGLEDSKLTFLSAALIPSSPLQFGLDVEVAKHLSENVSLLCHSLLLSPPSSPPFPPSSSFLSTETEHGRSVRWPSPLESDGLFMVFD